MRSEVPNANVPHFLFLGEMGPVLEFIQILRRINGDKIVSSLDYHEDLVIQNTTVWKSKEDFDNFNRQLFEAFPNLAEIREKYHTDNNIKWSVTLEEIE